MITEHLDPEIVICAAVVATNGTIIRCHRHHDGIEALTRRNLLMLAQGFVTSRNRYVSRTDAMRLQVLAGVSSTRPGGYRGDQLFSEDLY